ncbi:hypothetical protein [Endozoicomonas sp. Mp262]
MAYPFQKSRKHLCANSLITTISESYEQIPEGESLILTTTKHCHLSLGMV